MSGDIIWCYAEEEDSERWRGYCASREEAIKEGAAEIGFDGGSTFYVAPFARARAAKYIPSANDILEMASERAYDDGGEDPLEASKEAESELDAFLVAWAEKHVDPLNFYSPTGKPERVTIPTPEAP
jgi:hypothetical protein